VELAVPVSMEMLAAVAETNSEEKDLRGCWFCLRRDDSFFR
jgi:hypothetical protein